MRRKLNKPFLNRRQNKYKNIKIKIDDHLFDSKAEAADYIYLREKEKNKKIKDLELQPKFDLVVKDKKLASYRADFKFFDLLQNKNRVIDRKGIDTPLSKRSRKHVKLQDNIEVEVWKLSSESEFFRDI